MKTVTGKIISSAPVSLSKAARVLSKFAATDNGASQAVNAYLRRASAAFNELRQVHKELEKSSKRERKHGKVKLEMDGEGSGESGQEPSPSVVTRSADEVSLKVIGVNSVSDGERDKHKKKRKKVRGELSRVGDVEAKINSEDGEQPSRSELAQKLNGRTEVEKAEEEIGRILSFEENGEAGRDKGGILMEEESKKEKKKKKKKKKRKSIGDDYEKHDNSAEQRSRKKKRSEGVS